MSMKTCITLAAAMAMGLGVRASTILSSGHADIGIGYHDHHLELHVHQEEPFEAEYEPGEVTFLVGPAARMVSPGGTFTGLLGPAGSAAWVLGTTPNPDLPFLGWGTEELESADWLGNISLTLSAVSGPGHFSVWGVNAFGTPQVHMTTSDGISGSDSLSLLPASHSHYFVGFTAPGTYDVTLVASGNHVTDGFVTSEAATYRFEVVPEPSTWALLGLGTVGMLFWARRRS